MCPSNLLIAPTTKIFLFFKAKLLIKNFDLKLSVPSTIISNFSIIFSIFLEFIFLFIALIFIDGLISFNFFFKILTFDLPISSELYNVCLCKFEQWY